MGVAMPAKRNGRSCPFFLLRETNLHKPALLSALVFFSVLSAHGQAPTRVGVNTQPAARGVGPRGDFPRVEILEAYSYLHVDTAGHPNSGSNLMGGNRP